MIEVKARLKKWGNSFGIVVPQKVLRENGGIKENEEITILIIKNKPDLKKLFGAHKFKKSTSKIMKEIDEALYNE